MMQVVLVVGHTKDHCRRKPFQYCPTFSTPMSSNRTFSCSSSGGVNLAPACWIDHPISMHLPWHPDASVGTDHGMGTVTSPPTGQHLQQEALHQAKHTVPCRIGPGPTTSKWTLLKDFPTGLR